MRIPEDHLMARINKVLDGRAFICGGALRSYIEGNEPRDIDVFLRENNSATPTAIFYDLLLAFPNSSFNDNQSNEELDYFSIDLIIENYKVTIITPCISLGRQLYGTPEELCKGFDFNVVAMCLLPDNSILFGGDHGETETIWSIKNRMFARQKHCIDDARTAKRIEKYKSYGYQYMGYCI